MNRMKRPITNKLQKKISKEVRSAQGRYSVPETQQYSDTLTAKEMLKKYPKKEAQKREALVKSIRKEMSIKKKTQHKNISKRTNTRLVDDHESPPAHIHPEGKRWIKTLVKQNRAERTVQAHKGLGIGRKK